MGMLRQTAAAFKISNRVVWLCSRRLGKTHGLCWRADKAALHIPGADIIYGAATEASLREFSGPIMDCIVRERGGPRPIWKSSESTWFYPQTGSRITLIGLDQVIKIDRARGRDACLVIVDEAALVPYLPYAITDVLAPTLIKTNGQMIIASTAPKSPAHPFAEYVRQANADGTLVFRTIEDALNEGCALTEAAIELYAKEAGGKNSTAWRREMMCEIVPDEKSAVIPEWEAAKGDCVVCSGGPKCDHSECSVQMMPPSHALRFVAIDGGHIDMCVAALGYVDWLQQLLVIEDEVALHHCTSPQIAQAVRDQEIVRWGNMPVQRRVIDAPAQTVADLNAAGLQVQMLVKDEKQSSVTRLRERVAQRGILVHPRCKTILSHLEGAQWAPNGKDFVRVPEMNDKPGHHFDGLDGTRYLNDIADFRTNPFPQEKTLGEKLGMIRGNVPSQQGLSALVRGPRRAA